MCILNLSISIFHMYQTLSRVDQLDSILTETNDLRSMIRPVAQSKSIPPDSNPAVNGVVIRWHRRKELRVL